MDLSDVHVKKAKEMGCMFAISTDAHSINDLKNITLGESIARRGWLESARVLNTRSVKDVQRILASK